LFCVKYRSSDLDRIIRSLLSACNPIHKSQGGSILI